MAFWSRFFGSAGSQALGVSFGVAAVPSLIPAAQFLENEAWRLHPDKPPDAIILSQGVAQGQVDPDSAKTWAREQGFGDTAWQALVDVANVGPDLGLAYQAFRRGLLSPGEFNTALKRTGLEDQWFAALRALKELPLTPDTIANAVHRGIMRDPSLIVREPPTTAGKVEQIPPSPIDPATEAEWSGIDHERLRVMVGTTGLPPGLVQMLQLLNRGEVTEDDVRRAVAESNLRNEYMDVVLALRRHLLTPHEYAEAELRGVLQPGAAQAGAELSGIEPQDYQTLFQILGRPLTVHQITQALAHGVDLGGTYADVPEPYQDAIRRSAIRPEYARMAYALRYTYPAAFVLRTLTQSHDLTQQQAETILKYQGWEPTLAKQVSTKWAEGTASTGGGHVSKAETQLWTTTHRSYVAEEIDDAAATDALKAAKVDAAEIPQVLALWQAERALIRAQLSAKEIAKAYYEQVVNPATGQPWTQADALAALHARGYSDPDARTLLEL